MLKKYKKDILPVLMVLFLMSVLLVAPANAQLGEIIDRQLLDLKGIGLPGEPDEPADPVVRLVKMILGFLALVFLILLLYAGFKWMTSGGNAETIDKSKKIITSALIGLAIIFLSYAITAFIFDVVLSSA